MIFFRVSTGDLIPFTAPLVEKFINRGNGEVTGKLCLGDFTIITSTEKGYPTLRSRFDALKTYMTEAVEQVVEDGARWQLSTLTSWQNFCSDRAGAD
jgi:hypothetical protein